MWQWAPLELAPRMVQGVALGSGLFPLGSVIDGIVVAARRLACNWELHLAGGACLIAKVRVFSACTILSSGVWGGCDR